MTLANLLRELDAAGRAKLAAGCKTTVPYLYKLAGGHCMPSVEMFTRLNKRDDRLVLADFVKARAKRIAEHKRISAKALKA